MNQTTNKEKVGSAIIFKSSSKEKKFQNLNQKRPLNFRGKEKRISFISPPDEQIKNATSISKENLMQNSAKQHSNESALSEIFSDGKMFTMESLQSFISSSKSGSSSTKNYSLPKDTLPNNYYYVGTSLESGSVSDDDRVKSKRRSLRGGFEKLQISRQREENPNHEVSSAHVHPHPRFIDDEEFLDLKKEDLTSEKTSHASVYVSENIQRDYLQERLW